MTQKIQPQEAYRHVKEDDALLVCAYDSKEKFDQNHLQGAIPLQELQSKENHFSSQKEMIFYCA